MKNLKNMETEALRETLRTIKTNRAALVTAYGEHRDETPADTVTALVATLGYTAAVETVAEAINIHSEFDGRISDTVRAWAASIETAANREELEEFHFYGLTGSIHPAHLNQIANAMKNYTPEEPETPTEEPKTEETPAEEPTAEYRLNEVKNGVEIIFTAKPADEILAELKAAGFRWGRGYWWAKQTPERLALAARLADGEEIKDEPKKTAGTPQNRIKIYYNGFKLDGSSRLSVKVFYSPNNDGSITIHAKDYKDLPRDLFAVRNETDIMTDYFDEDHATVEPSHPLYKYIAFAAYKAKEHDYKRSAEHYEKRATTTTSGYYKKWYADEAAAMRERLAALEPVADPGQPTAEDLEAIDRERQEAENARIKAEHEAEIAEREKVLAERHAGFEYINTVSAKYPIKDGEPVVYIPFSENPAFYSFMVADTTKTTLHPDGTTTEEVLHKMPRCVLSVTAAEIVLKHFDEIEAAKGCGYDKTDFIIKWTDESGEPWEYSGRYDLGDNDGGLIEHIRSLAEWDRTHDIYGHETDTPQEISESRFAWVELLKRYNVAA